MAVKFQPHKASSRGEQLVARGASHLSRAAFRTIARLAEEASGLYLTDRKLNFVETRLRKRVQDLGMTSFDEYVELLLRGNRANELPELINRLTTQKTSFFREPAHLEFLRDIALPSLRTPVTMWSAGCSTGQEAYSMAMVAAQRLWPASMPGFNVLAIDVSEAALKIGRRAVYPSSEMTAVPPALARRFLMRGHGHQSQNMRIVPEIRARVDFQRESLFLQASDGLRPQVIFCRNVLIYFSASRQTEAVLGLTRQLEEGGFLVLGHSEVLLEEVPSLRRVAPTIYQKIHLES